MKIKKINFENFRNYESAEFVPGDLTNVIYGDNAQGKTNILEACYIFCHGKSHRTHSDSELVKFGANCAKIQMEFSDAERDYKAVIQIDKNGKKIIKINNVVINKLSKLMRYFNVIMFSPEELSLIKGAPGVRRRFMDRALSQLYPSYLVSLINYNKALMQKNSILREIKKTKKALKSTLFVWNDILAEEGSKIMNYRMEFIEKIGVMASNIASEISNEKLEISYLQGMNVKSHDKNSLFEYFENHIDREIDMGSSCFGIQRDDLAININEKEARYFSSQGQQRTAALAMKIAEADFIYEIREEYPILLLDDIMSELDSGRRTYLWNRIKERQVLITCTDKETPKSETTAIFYVKSGTVKREV